MISGVSQASEFTGFAESRHLRFDNLVAGIVTLHVAYHQLFAGGARCFDDGFRLRDGDSHRFLHENVLACEQQVLRDFALEREVR